MNQRVYSRLLRRVEIWGSLCFGMFRACLGRTPSQLQAKSLWTHCEKDSVKTCVQMPAVHFFRVPHNKVVAVVDPSRAGQALRMGSGWGEGCVCVCFCNFGVWQLMAVGVG